MMNTPKMILIDVDGTLIDSIPDLTYCIDEMLNHLGMAGHGRDKVSHWVGNGVERLVRRALIGQLDGEPEPALFERAYPVFMALYQDNTSKRSRLYPGVKEALDYLQEAGYKLGCVTNKAEAFTFPLLKDMGLLDYFQSIVCGDTLPRKKPDPLPLLHSAKLLGVTAEQSLMLGDSVSDVKAARAAGFQIICTSYGYNHGVSIHEAKPDRVIDSMLELMTLL